MSPRHGGRLQQRAAAFDWPLDQWLDLSTGINPQGWPVPPLPARVWQQLPDEEDGLEAVARNWLALPPSVSCVPVAGSQAAIQALPRLRPRGRVGVPRSGYAEHGWWWRHAGHEVIPLCRDQVAALLPTLDVLVLIRPNNPTGDHWSVEMLLDWQARLARRGGWLVVDEAFLMPGEPSLARMADRPGLVVLRSLGKFFGLAGLRAGLVLTAPVLARALMTELGPWSVSGPARWVLCQALADRSWQRQALSALEEQSVRLRKLLAGQGLRVQGQTPLFCYVPHPQAERIEAGLAARAILVRHWRAEENGGQAALRFGLPPAQEAAWQRLERALAEVLADRSASERDDRGSGPL